ANKCIEDINIFEKQVEPKEDFFGIAEGPFKYKKINLFDKKIAQIKEKDLLELANLSIDAALKNAKRVSGILHLSNSENYLFTSKNVKAKEKETAAYFSIRAFLDKNASGHSVCVSRNLKDFEPDKAGLEAGEFAKKSANPVEIKPGKYTILFHPLAFAVLLERIGHAASIFDVENGASWFTNCIGKQISPEFINIYDNGILKNGLGSSLFDAEGVPTQNTPIIEKGIFKTYLYNTSYARKYKTKSTGNAGLLSPRPTNIYLAPSKKSFEELLSDIKNGIYITNLWYTRFQNYTSGEFSTIPRDAAFIIENGELKTSIKNLRISDNMPNLLKNISDLASDIKQIRSWEVETPTWTPHVLVDNLNITKPV
ncbi:MAG: TldD/PmbA family protein, partial [Candidatus Nanoarchaeia archaeon]